MFEPINLANLKQSNMKATIFGYCHRHYVKVFTSLYVRLGACSCVIFRQCYNKAFNTMRELVQV